MIRLNDRAFLSAFLSAKCRLVSFFVIVVTCFLSIDSLPLPDSLASPQTTVIAPSRTCAIVIGSSFNHFSTLRFRSIHYLKCVLLRDAPSVIVVESGSPIPLLTNATYVNLGASNRAKDEVHALWNSVRNVSGVRIGSVLLGDESMKATHPPHADFIAKTYRSQVKNLSFLYIPCGFASAQVGWNATNFPSTYDCSAASQPPVPAAARTRSIEWNFLGSLRRNRGRIVEELRPQVVDSEKQVIHVTEGFGKGGAEPYEEVLSRSKFTVCPCGNNAETKRFWEALALGSIPVVEDCAEKGGRQSLFVSFLRENNVPFPITSSFININDTLAPYMNDIDKAQKEAMAWFARFEEATTTKLKELALG